ncbi:unnamed protein product [Meloidogyne enterolobii]|uniref:Uncharacterized protein n=1 Tax=Meloidogyne enterolobii TaxID=390850 RepID=A0ACB0ZSG4_MELEN
MILNSILVVALFFIEINEFIYTEEEDESQIAGTPSELQAFANHDSIQVSWLPPREDNVLIRGFQIGWGINIPDIEKTIVDSNVRQYTIRNLKPNREYVISLRAFNKKGQGFPIYETVKTYSSGFLTTLPPNNFVENIHAPVGLFAETLSASQIHLYWTDPNDEAFNQYYTIKYAMSGEADGLAKEINTSETDYQFDNLRPDTQYEFAVKIARTNHWSLIAINRTFPAPPSSPPRDITLVGPQSEKDDPNIVTLNWQPPKYSNGEIKEYILFYSNKFDAPESEWTMESIKGDRLSLQIRGLLSKTTYYFKLQAKNSKGFGPFTPITSFLTPETLDISSISDQNNKFSDNVNSTFSQQIVQLLSKNLTNVFLGIVTIVLLVLVVAVIIACTRRKPRRQTNVKHPQYSYIPGRKYSQQTGDDNLWIQQNGTRFAAVLDNSGTLGRAVCENFEMPTSSGEERRILLVDRQQRAFIASNPHAHFGSPSPQYNSQYLPPSDGQDLSRNCYNTAIISPHGRNLGHPTPNSTPRNPHVVHTRTDRQQVKVDLAVGNQRTGAFSNEELIDNDRSASKVHPSSISNHHIMELEEHRQQPKMAHVVRPIAAIKAANASPSAFRNVCSSNKPKTSPLMNSK